MCGHVRTPQRAAPRTRTPLPGAFQRLTAPVAPPQRSSAQNQGVRAALPDAQAARPLALQRGLSGAAAAAPHAMASAAPAVAPNGNGKVADGDERLAALRAAMARADGGAGVQVRALAWALPPRTRTICRERKRACGRRPMHACACPITCMCAGRHAWQRRVAATRTPIACAPHAGVHRAHRGPTHERVPSCALPAARVH